MYFQVCNYSFIYINMKYIQQLDITDCGAACIAMIASHYGSKLSISEIRSTAGTDIIGTNINGMLLASKNYGLKALSVKGTKEAIVPTLTVPFIVHMHIYREDGKWIDHYVVVKKITKKKIEIWDPDPLYKKQKLSYDAFFNYWTGYAIFLEPDVGFTKMDKKITKIILRS